MTLAIGLGNALMGDDGIGWHVIQRLLEDPRLPAGTELLWGGADLLACGDRIEGRERVFLVDAMLGGGEPGSVAVFEEPFAELEQRQGSAHHLSPAQSLALLRAANPELKSVRVTLLAIAIESAKFGPELSPPLVERMPGIVDRVVEEVRRPNAGP